MILAAQVPVRICTDARDEATFIQIFNLLDIDDRKTMQRYIPRKYDIVDHDLPKYHSLYYDVRADHLVMLPPGPEPAESYRQILDRLPIVEEEKPPELPRRHRV